MPCRRDYTDRVVAIFAHQIHSEYYCRNISVYIGGILLEHFSSLSQTGIKASTKSCPRHAVFHSFLSYDSKQDYITTTEHIKRFI